MRGIGRERGTMKTKLPLDIEHVLLRGVMEGAFRAHNVNDKELSNEGRIVFEAIKRFLHAHPNEVPTIDVIKLNAVELGLTTDNFEYFTGLRRVPTGKGVEQAVDIARRRMLLDRLMEKAGAQVADSKFNPSELRDILDSFETLDKLEPIGFDGVDPPSGVPLKTFPMISEATNGLMGFWTIGGEPGLGKTALAWQIAMEYSRDSASNVLYYDLDSTGRAWLQHRTFLACNRDEKKARAYLSRIYHRPSIYSLEDDLRRIRPPALVVVDSIQTLPSKSGQKRETLDRWLARFKMKVGEGYTVLAVSEKNRESYDTRPSMKDFKESGEIEYACSVGIMLKGDPDNYDPNIEVHLVKNRHGAKKGRVCYIVRDPVLKWVFNERSQQPIPAVEATNFG